MLTVKKICDNDGMMVTVSRKMAKILTVSRKSHHLLRPSFPEKASATPPLPHPPSHRTFRTLSFNFHS